MILSTESVRCVGRSDSIECEMEVRSDRDETFFVNGIFAASGALMTVARQSVMDADQPVEIVEQYTDPEAVGNFDFIQCFATLSQVANEALRQLPERYLGGKHGE